MLSISCHSLHFSAIHDCKNDLHASFAVLLPFYIGSSELTFFDREVSLPYFQIQTDVKLPMDQPFAEIGACYFFPLAWLRYYAH